LDARPLNPPAAGAKTGSRRARPCGFRIFVSARRSGEASGYTEDAFAQPSGLKTRSREAGNFSSFAAGRIGRRLNSPPQLGHPPLRTPSAHARQNVHSNEQIVASRESGGKSMSQHSQFGLRSSIVGS